MARAERVRWGNPPRTTPSLRGSGISSERTLILLSKARAEAVGEALVERGLDASCFTTQGVGASDQLVPDSNHKDRGQNHRVALFLEKN